MPAKFGSWETNVGRDLDILLDRKPELNIIALICGLEVFSLLETRTPLSRDFVFHRMYFQAWFGAKNAAYSTSSPTPIAPKTAYWLPLTVIIEWDIVPPCRFTFPLQARSPQITPSVIDRPNLNLVCTLIRSFKEKRAGGCEAG